MNKGKKTKTSTKIAGIVHINWVLLTLKVTLSLNNESELFLNLCPHSAFAFQTKFHAQIQHKNSHGFIIQLLNAFKDTFLFMTILLILFDSCIFILVFARLSKQFLELQGLIFYVFKVFTIAD